VDFPLGFPSSMRTSVDCLGSRRSGDLIGSDSTANGKIYRIIYKMWGVRYQTSGVEISFPYIYWLLVLTSYGINTVNDKA
jgi:hypothetical protein